MIPLRCAFQKKLWKATNDYCYSLTSSNVCTVKKICSRWYRSQFNKIEKAWVRVEILCLDFPKIRSNQYMKSRKVTTFEICKIFSNLYFSYVRGYKATLLGGNNKRNVFLQESCRKWGRETISRLLLVS